MIIASIILICIAVLIGYALYVKKKISSLERKINSLTEENISLLKKIKKQKELSYVESFIKNLANGKISRSIIKLLIGKLVKKLALNYDIDGPRFLSIVGSIVVIAVGKAMPNLIDPEVILEGEDYFSSKRFLSNVAKMKKEPEDDF